MYPRTGSDFSLSKAASKANEGWLDYLLWEEKKEKKGNYNQGKKKKKPQNKGNLNPGVDFSFTVVVSICYPTKAANVKKM